MLQQLIFLNYKFQVPFYFQRKHSQLSWKYDQQFQRNYSAQKIAEFITLLKELLWGIIRKANLKLAQWKHEKSRRGRSDVYQNITKIKRQFTFQLMHKRYHSKKERNSQQRPQCRHCIHQMANCSNLTQFCSKILLNKYEKSRQFFSQSETISEIINYKGSNNVKTGYREAVHLSRQTEMLAQYFNFKSTVQNIKPLILERTNKDRYSVVHFYGSAFQMTLKHQTVIKRLSLTKRKPVNSDRKVDCQTLTQQVRWQKNEKNLQPKKKQVRNTQNQTPSLRRLTRNLSNMVKKYDDNFQFHPSMIFQLMDFAPNHALDLTKLEKQQIFKKQLQQNISIIPPKKNIERLHTIAGDFNQEYEENYGLRGKEKIFESRGLVKNDLKASKVPNYKKIMYEAKQNIAPNQRLHTDYECIKSNSKKKSISNKKPGQKFGLISIKSTSKKKQTIKASSITKSRIVKKF